MELRGQVAIITGGARGIGRATTIELANAGARVLINYQRSAGAAEALAAEIVAAGGDAFAYQADVADEQAVTGMVQAVLDHWGKIDILVNNAGITADAPLARLRPEQWQHVIETDLTSVFLCCRSVIPAMQRAGYGRIVSVSSLAALAGNVGQTNYAAAKAGIIGLSRSLAREVARDGITVNVVAPGYIETDMVETVPETLRAWALQAIAIGRFGRPEEVSAAIRFLVSPRASYITGHVLTIDGGWVMP
ncbi:3-oxoacyl-ACP reductase FabG [Chloroflexus sp. Y-396-1]|uniref:3-oxoacyl-ACP reductase FabG n=1 Tax=Chloroflexus sp. Y-396-1 TaxID=867845 RepID=UPI00048EA918|nr:3-oxoacyl-ACP reductase FabG [Chloroflexus sp. Y-396-1]